jgi:hypothetical protein
LAGEEPAQDDIDRLRSVNPGDLPALPGAAAAARDEMRRLVVEFARRFGLTAVQVWELVDGYEKRAWPRERDCAECPPLRLGRRQEHCWRILRAYGRTPSEKTIRRILERKRFGQVNNCVSNTTL